MPAENTRSTGANRRTTGDCHDAAQRARAPEAQVSAAVDLLREHNIWRRGGDGPQTDPIALGIAIDVVVNALSARQPPSGGEVFAWFREQPRAWEVVKDSDLSERPAPAKMQAEGWIPVYTAPPSAPVGVEVCISALQSTRDRMMVALPPKFGDAFDGDFDTMLEAIKALKKRTAPPSAPVGVEGLVTEMREAAARSPINNGVLHYWADKLEALAQQPAPPSAPVGVEAIAVAWTDADMESPCGAEVAFLRRLSEAHWVPAEVGGMLRHSARLLEHRATALRSIYDLLNVETEADAGAEIARLHAIAQQTSTCGTCGGCGWIDYGHEQDDGRIVAAPDDCPECAQQPAPPSAPVGVEVCISALQSTRDRMMAALPPKFGDSFDGDFDVMLEAINTMKRLRTAVLAQQPAAVTQPTAGAVSNAYACKGDQPNG